MTAIYKRELKSYFCSMTGCVFVAFLTAFMGIYYMVYNMLNGYPYFSYTLSSLTMLLLLGVPVLTMRSLSEERRSRTDQLLLTSPASVWGIVMGKYLSMVTVFAIPMLISCLCPLIIKANGTAYLKEDYASILIFFLMGCVYISIGLFISSLTESQLIAAAGTFGILFLLILWPSLISFLPVSAEGSLAGFALLWSFVCFILYRLTAARGLSAGLELIGLAALAALWLIKKELFDRALTNVLSHIALTDVFNRTLSSHIFDLSGMIYYLSAAFLLLFLTVQSIERRRWN